MSQPGQVLDETRIGYNYFNKIVLIVPRAQMPITYLYKPMYTPIM